MFKPNSAELLAGTHALLDKAGAMLKGAKDVKITIEGHSASIGKPDFEMKISKDRAEAIKDYLVKNFGIEADRIKTVGYGANQPVGDNSTDEGKAKNRRIEYFIGHDDPQTVTGRKSLV
ncbi:MAG: OmpA family protein [bacterium]|nr:OmpA family protein [bacterium]